MIEPPDTVQVAVLKSTVDRLERQLEEKIEAGDRALRNHITSQVKELAAALAAAQREANTAQQTQAREVKNAFESATSLSKAHNDLLRKMERQADTFSTKEQAEARVSAVERAFAERFSRIEAWQARFTGGMALLGLIGVANLVKVWGG